MNEEKIESIDTMGAEVVTGDAWKSEKSSSSKREPVDGTGAVEGGLMFDVCDLGVIGDNGGGKGGGRAGVDAEL